MLSGIGIIRLWFVSAALAITLVACSKEESSMSSARAADYRQVALQFAQLLVVREYPKAYAVTSQEYRKRNTADQLRAAFEAVIPADWGDVGPIEGGHTMAS